MRLVCSKAVSGEGLLSCAHKTKLLPMKISRAGVQPAVKGGRAGVRNAKQAHKP